MEIANQNAITFTVADGQAMLAQQMAKNRRVYEQNKRSPFIKTQLERARILKALDIHYDKMAALHDESLYNAIKCCRRRRTREAKQAEKIQPLEQKTRWLQHLANILAKTSS